MAPFAIERASNGTQKTKKKSRSKKRLRSLLEERKNLALKKVKKKNGLGRE